MATLKQLEAAFMNAHNAGDTAAAQTIANAIFSERKRRAEDPSIDVLEQIPGNEIQVPGTFTKKPEPSFGEKALGVGEAALATATAATGGMLGGVKSALPALAKEVVAGNYGTPAAAQRIEEETAKGAASWTYAPRTEKGQEYAQDVGEFAGEYLMPLTSVMPQLETLGQTVKAAGDVRSAMAPGKPVGLKQTLREQVVEPYQEKIANIPKRAIEKEAVKRQELEQNIKQAETLAEKNQAKSALDRFNQTVKAEAEKRVERFEEMGVPYTQGQATRKYEHQQFEREMAKNAELGEPIRQRYEDQNAIFLQKFDELLDNSKAKLSDVSDIGASLVKRLESQLNRKRRRMNYLYQQAALQNGNNPVSLTNLTNHLNNSVAESEVANLLKSARAKAKHIGAVIENANGTLSPGTITMKDAEMLRKSINMATDESGVNIRQSAIMKDLIDQDTAPAGGPLYAKARAARRDIAVNYENVNLIDDLLSLKKGSSDRKIAMEKILQKTMISEATPIDSLKHLKNLLKNSMYSKDRQVWNELKGGLIRHMTEQITKNVQMDALGNRMVSPKQLDTLIKSMDRSGKLELVFGKKDTETLRKLNQISLDLFTSPPGSINTSNTTSAIINAFKNLSSSVSGGISRAPFVKDIVQGIKDSALKQKVQRTLQGI